MVLYQLIEKKRNIDKEIYEVERDLYSKFFEDNLKYLFSLFNKRQDCLLLIYKLNEQNSITIKDSQISLANAVCICKTLENKIDSITNLIENYDDKFFVLNEQRKNLISEYELLKILILKKDLEVKV